MNGTFLHLAFNHIPVLGVPFSMLLLAGGLVKKSRDLIQAGFVALVLVALLTIVAFKTGGPAARIVRDLPGITRATIHAHAEAADDGFWAVEILGIAGILGLWFLKKSDDLPKGWTTLTLLGALFVSCWMVWIAHLGGLIRHPEMGRNFIVPAAAPAAVAPARQ